MWERRGHGHHRHGPWYWEEPRGRHHWGCPMCERRMYYPTPSEQIEDLEEHKKDLEEELSKALEASPY